MSERNARLLVLACCALFVALGLVFAPMAGLQNDEALFAAPLYNPPWDGNSVSIFGKHVQLMLLDYLGTVKTWICAPLFNRWRPGPYSLRLPPILFGAACIWLSYLLLIRIANRRAALVACALLATDASFLLTSVFDWGPVALQHLLTMGGLLMLYEAHQRRSHVWLGAGFFLFGLVMWDKALFLWVAAGLGVAALAVVPRQFLSWLRPRALAVAAAAFLMGALPMVLHNIQHRENNIKGRFRLDTSEVGKKFAVLRASLDGAALYGYIPGDDAGEFRRPPVSLIERASVRVSESFGGPRRGYLAPALALALLIGAALWRAPSRRAFWFFTITVVVAWFSMAVTREAGGGAHHTLLLWPYIPFVVAIGFASLQGRVGTVALVCMLVLVCGSNLLVINENFAELTRNGAGLVWTDAINRLPAALKQRKPEAVCIFDWGVVDNMFAMSRGHLPMRVCGEAVKDAPTAEDRKSLDGALSTPNMIFLLWADGREVTAGTNARLRKMAAGQGYTLQTLESVYDRNGRRTFDLVRPRRNGEAR